VNTVFHTVDTWGPGGAETVCVELAAGLDPHRFRSVAAVIREGWVYDALRARRVDTTITRIGSLPIDLGYLSRLARAIHRDRATVIQSHLLTANLYCGLVAKLFNLPAIATFHGMVDVEPNDRFAAAKLKLITRCVSKLVFVSEALRRFFHERYPVDSSRTTVIPNGIDPNHFSPSPNTALRDGLGLPADAFIVGLAGNVRPAKGYDDLLRAAARLRETHPTIHFVVAGEHGQPLFAHLTRLRRELGLEKRVLFPGFFENIASFHNGVDLYVSSSTSEGFSLTTVQAMACGIPVICTRSGGPEEIITNGRDGLLVPVGDPAALATAIAGLVDDPARRNAFSVTGRATVLERFTLQRMIRSYEALYENVA
jgi:glycosyltransferase involved in cell wall biosynthesis